LRLIPGGTCVPPHKTAAHRGKTPHTAASHEDTSSDTSSAPCFRRDRLCAGRVRLGHMTNSLFTLQTTPPARVAPDGVSNLLQTPVVEVNGFEPMTSCLQSRRSLFTDA